MKANVTYVKKAARLLRFMVFILLSSGVSHLNSIHELRQKSGSEWLCFMAENVTF